MPTMTEIAHRNRRLPARSSAGRGGLAALAVAASFLLATARLDAQPAKVPAEAEIVAELMERLDPAQRAELVAYRRAQAEFEDRAAAFWSGVEEKRAVRRAKRKMGAAIEAGDYAAGFPPEYTGPKLAPQISRLWDELKQKAPPRPIWSVADVLAAAGDRYNFAPEPVDEREFKRRYATEALQQGLSKDQVVRVYALETGGQGTYDMQAGINPITRQGKPISTALGYAQLLHANSVNELVKHGAGFIARLERMARSRGIAPARKAALEAKAGVLRRMLANARKVPNEWADHIRYANTPDGLAVHALNLDADVGPWLQVLKLDGLRQTASRNGRASLTGAELELMNLAGPMTGLEMMQPVAHAASTVNFFSRRGYEVNSVVRKRTAAELLAELDRRMVVNMQRPGAKEFAAIFDEVIALRQARQ